VAEGRKKSKILSDFILDTIGESRIDKYSNSYVMNYGVLNGYAGSMLQTAYCKRFIGYGEDDGERIAEAFKFKNCIKNQAYIDLLKRMLHC